MSDKFDLDNLPLPVFSIDTYQCMETARLAPPKPQPIQPPGPPQPDQEWIQQHIIPMIKAVEAMDQEQRDAFYYELNRAICKNCQRVDCSGYCHSNYDE